jgi:hypothetical protein
MDCDLPDRLLRRLRRGESRQVRHAQASDLGQFQAERSKCHDNVGRWCHDHPGDIPIKGWLVTGTSQSAVFDKHSVINRGKTGLLDITPLPDRACKHLPDPRGQPGRLRQFAEPDYCGPYLKKCFWP